MTDVKSNLCKIRELYRAITEFESNIIKDYGLTLNEAMLLCSLTDKELLTSTEISEALGLSCSNTSKVIRSVEDKKLIKRNLSEEDRRSMLFNLTDAGKQKLKEIKSFAQDLPENLKRYIILGD
jgi:DNA-binding MarR family transcriptional regulator